MLYDASHVSLCFLSSSEAVQPCTVLHIMIYNVLHDKHSLAANVTSLHLYKVRQYASYTSAAAQTALWSRLCM